QAVNQMAQYGDKGVYQQGSWPGGRAVAGFAIDSFGNLWIYGGLGFNNVIAGSELFFKKSSPPPHQNQGVLNDLWVFNGTMWAWMGGRTEANVLAAFHNESGVESPLSMPHNSYFPAAWMDDDDNFWFYGGAVSNLTSKSGSISSSNQNQKFLHPFLEIQCGNLTLGMIRGLGLHQILCI